MGISQIRLLFVVAGVYDFAIGLVFLGWGPWLFDLSGVPHPNHWAYIQFGSLLLMVFGLMFFTIAASPVSQRNLIPFGMLLKTAYCGLVGYYWALGECPTLFQPFAVADAIMLALFAFAFAATFRSPQPSPALGVSPP